jgi:WD40 repeat protein
MTAAAPPRVGNPYVGPTSFRLGDPLYGRDEEREDLLDLLVAERIVLLYSPSGAGKTSLIQAALVPALRDAGFEVLPLIRVTHALEPRPGMPTPRNRYVLGTLLSLEEGIPAEDQFPVAELATMHLRDYLTARDHRGSHVDRDGRPGNEVLVFDQFEEVLTADPTDEAAKHEFFQDLGEALRDRGHWALFAMREDFLAALDPYLRHVPTRLRTTFRLDLLSVPEALDAMRRPAQHAGVDFPEEAAIQLVDDLRRVRVQRPGGRTEEALGSYVEPVQLQVSCRLLWSMLPPDATRITPADVAALGNVDQALAEYYADRVRRAAERTGVREAAIREWFEERLITPQGLRGQVLEGPEVAGAAGPALLGALVDAHLIRAETRRQATWYELAHDRLIEPVRRDNAAWRAQYLTDFERAAMLWEAEGKADRLLLLGPDLVAAEQDPAVRAGALKARQREFLEASRRADAQVRRDARTATTLRRSARRLKLAVALVTLLALVAGAFLVRSQRAETQARQQESLYRLVVDGHRTLAWDQDPAVTRAAAAAGMTGEDDLGDETRSLLYQAASASPVSGVLRGEGPATVAELSDDGSAAVTAGADGLASWDRATGDVRARLPLDDVADITVLNLSRDGNTVVVGFSGGDVLRWDVPSGDERRWPGGAGSVYSAVPSPDGSRIATIGEGRVVQVWDRDGAPLFDVEDPAAQEVYDVDFSPDGATFVTVSDAPTAVFWDVASGAEVRRLAVTPGGAGRVTYSSDGATLATVGLDGTTVTSWNSDTGAQLGSMDLKGQASYTAFSPDLSRVLSVYPFGDVTVSDARTGTTIAGAYDAGASLLLGIFDPADPGQVLVLPEDTDPAFWRPTAAADYGNYVTAAAAGGDRVFTLWDDGVVRVSGVDGETVLLPTAGEDAPSDLVADASGRRVLLTTGTGLHVWDVDAAAEVTALNSGDHDLYDAALVADGSMVVTVDYDDQVALWDADTGRITQKLGPAAEYVTSMEAGAGGAALLLMRDTTTRVVPEAAQVVSPSGLEPPFRLWLGEGAAPADPSAEAPTPEGSGGRGDEELQDSVSAAVLSADGRTVVVGTQQGKVAAFDTGTGERRWLRAVHDGEVRAVVMSPAGDLLTVGRDHRVAVLDAASGARVREVPSTQDLVSATFTSDGGRIAVASQYGVLSSVPLDDGELIRLVGAKVTRDLTPGECADYGLAAGC